MKTKFFAIFGIVIAIINIIFATVNLTKVQMLYDNPTDKAALKNLKSIRDFSIVIIIIFGIELIALIFAYPKKISQPVASF